MKKVKFPLLRCIPDLPIPTRKITHVGIHHSASSFGDAKTINGWHKAPPNNFTDRNGDGRHIGYHFIIHNGTYYPKGWIELGRPIERIPAAHRPKNRNSIAICVIGNYSEERVNRPFDPRFQALALICVNLMLKMELESKDFLGHREINPTECPGLYVDCDIMRNYFLHFFANSIELDRISKWYTNHINKWRATKDRVSALQRILNFYFGARLVVDGILGPLTKDAWEMRFSGPTYQEMWELVIDTIKFKGAY